jgi:recombination protein RecT
MSTIGNAVAKKDAGPIGFVEQYQDQFTTQLPSHINAKQWLAVATGALRKPEIAQAAANNLGAFANALLTASRLGLEPGSESFYLTPRKVKGQLEILGIVGYQGLIDLMYRAGAVSSVIAEVVYERDGFEYQPGLHARPIHTIDWDSEDRGKLRLAYAYAVMKDGATSNVIVMNRADINRIKKSSQGSDSQYSPWTNHEPSMWLKSAVRQLAKWVPTSAEYRKEELRAVAQVAAEQQQGGIPVDVPTPHPNPGEYVDQVTGEVFQTDPDTPVEAELEPEGGWPEVAGVTR